MALKKRILGIILAVMMVVSYVPAMTFAAESSGQWQQTGSGTQSYAEFPSGYNTGSSLYSKYNKSKLSSYENETTKRVVTTTRTGYIYWHWSWRIGATSDNKYNFYINDSSAGDESHGSYPYFSDFESTSNYSMTDPDGHQDSENRCGYMWRNNPDADGSWWWYQIPVYKQTYTDYKWVSSSGDPNNTPGDAPDGNNASQPSSSGSGSDDPAKVTPEKTSVTSCTPKKKSCKIIYKKCPGKCTGYQIRYGTSKKFKGCNKKKIKGRKNCTVTINGLKTGTKYYYQVRCYRICGKKTYYSSWSKCRSFTTKKSKGKDPAKVKPNKTSIIKCKPGKKSCIITYKRCSSKCTGYQIRYCTNRKFKGCKKKTVKGSGNTSCSLSGLRPGTKYYIQIRSYCITGKKKYWSKWTDIKTVKTKATTTGPYVKLGGYILSGYGDVGGPVFGDNDQYVSKAGGYYIWTKEEPDSDAGFFSNVILSRSSSKGGKEVLIKRLRDAYAGNGSVTAISNGKTIYYTKGRSIFRTDINGRNKKRIVKIKDYGTTLAGRYGNNLYYVVSSNKLIRYNLKTHKKKTIFKKRGVIDSSGRYLICAENSWLPNKSVWIYDCKTGKSKKLSLKGQGGAAVIRGKTVYYYFTNNNVLYVYKCNTAGKNKKLVFRYGDSADEEWFMVPWLSDYGIGFVPWNEGTTYKYSFDTKKLTEYPLYTDPY